MRKAAYVRRRRKCRLPPYRKGRIGVHLKTEKRSYLDELPEADDWGRMKRL